MSHTDGTLAGERYSILSLSSVGKLFVREEICGIRGNISLCVLCTTKGILRDWKHHLHTLRTVVFPLIRGMVPSILYGLLY